MLTNTYLYAYVCLQVHLQTQQKGKIGLIKMGIKVVKSDGIFGLYNGLTASLLRQVGQWLSPIDRSLYIEVCDLCITSEIMLQFVGLSFSTKSAFTNTVAEQLFPGFV